MTDNQIEVGQRYKHFKGNTYKIIALGRDSESLVEVVVYQGEYTHPEFGPNPVWVRPLKDFVEKVEKDGKIIARFQIVTS